MLPLVGQKLALSSPGLGTSLMSVCIVAAQAGRVLLVEDNREVAEITASHLQELGFEVVHASDVDSARAVLRSADEALDLVLSDIVMPGQSNGLDLARTIRKEHGTKLPILLATGYSDVAQAAAEERFPVLRKPYDKQQLREATAKAIRAARLKVVA
jgi:two-component system NtrC family sensor kinase